MYGTIARLQMKPGGLKRLAQFENAEDPAEGQVAVFAFQMDEDPNEVYLVALFRDRESYHANANSPEQHARYEQMLEALRAEPEWHDGEVVFHQVTEPLDSTG